MPYWWRRGELNPCPKAHPQELLRAQFVVLHSLHSTPANRLTALVESCYMTGATLNPYTFTTNRRPGPEPWSSQAGRASLIRQPAKNNLCCLIYKRLRLLRKRPHFRPLFLLQHPRRSRYVPEFGRTTNSLHRKATRLTGCAISSRGLFRASRPAWPCCRACRAVFYPCTAQARFSHVNCGNKRSEE